jgi:hypothetical protein
LSLVIFGYMLDLNALPRMARRHYGSRDCRPLLELKADSKKFPHFAAYILTRGDMNNCFVGDQDIIFQIYYRGGQYLRPDIAEFANFSEIFWQKNSRYIGSQYKWGAQYRRNFWAKNFWRYCPSPCNWYYFQFNRNKRSKYRLK